MTRIARRSFMQGIAASVAAAFIPAVAAAKQKVVERTELYRFTGEGWKRV